MSAIVGDARLTRVSPPGQTPVYRVTRTYTTTTPGRAPHTTAGTIGFIRRELAGGRRWYFCPFDQDWLGRDGADSLGFTSRTQAVHALLEAAARVGATA